MPSPIRRLRAGATRCGATALKPGTILYRRGRGCLAGSVRYLMKGGDVRDR